MNSEVDLSSVVGNFQVDGEFHSATPYGSGHINDSYCVVLQRDGKPVRYMLQRINHSIFLNPAGLMENIQRVLAHLAAKMKSEKDSNRRALTLLSAKDHRCFHVDTNGQYWRMYNFIEGARSLEKVETTAQAFQAAKAIGQFQSLLADLPAPRLNDTIPNFHHTPSRFAALQSAIASDPVNRAIHVRPEIDFALARQPMVSVLLDANLPERVTHNDTKLNNVLLDDASGEGICVIDLDTVMPGLALFDFGDMVRTTTSPAQEDEQDLSQVYLQFPMFEALVGGYMSTAGKFLTKEEKQFLAFSGKLITFEMGIRFLADYLMGDIYYKVHRDQQNLDRCRTQFKLIQSIEEQEEKMFQLVESFQP